MADFTGIPACIAKIYSGILPEIQREWPFVLQWQYLGDEERNNTCDNQNGNKSFYCCFYITTNVIRGDGSRK